MPYCLYFWKMSLVGLPSRLPCAFWPLQFRTHFWARWQECCQTSVVRCGLPASGVYWQHFQWFSSNLSMKTPKSKYGFCALFWWLSVSTFLWLPLTSRNWCFRTGTAASFIISPLAADLFSVVGMLVSQQTGTKAKAHGLQQVLQLVYRWLIKVSNGDTAAYAQSYGLFTSAMAGGTLVGPVLGGYLKETFGWTTMAWGLGICVASGAIPVVSSQTCLSWFSVLICPT